jgi:hypothetical protein
MKSDLAFDTGLLFIGSMNIEKCGSLSGIYWPFLFMGQ